MRVEVKKMIKILLITFLFSFNALAEQENQQELQAAVNQVGDSLSDLQKAGKILLPCVPTTGSKGSVVLAPHFSLNGVKDDCDKFFDNNGNVGPWGNHLIKTITKLPAAELEKSFYSNDIPDMDFICPKFSEFSADLKLKFWVWTFASISWQESSCNEKVTAQGTNARAVGLLQLEDTRQMRKSRGDNCNVASVRDANNNLACGVDILHQQLLGADGDYFKNIGTGELFWKSSYWQHLRLKNNSPKHQKLLTERSQSQKMPKKADIKELVMRFPHCR